MEQINRVITKIDNLSLRERGIVFVGIIFVIFSLWDSLLMTPLEKEQNNVVLKLNSKNAERLVLINRFQKLMKGSKEDPNASNLARLKTLRSHLIDVQANLESSTGSLVSPEDMPKLLETVLHKTVGLTLLNLKSLGVTPIIAKVAADTTIAVEINNSDEKKLTADNIDNAYRHGLRIEISGDYLTTLNYLRNLEQLEWGFFWDSFNLTVNEYPEANVAIEVFTLSLDKEWIGV